MNGRQGSPDEGAEVLLITPEQLEKQTDAMRSEVFEQLRAHVDGSLSILQQRPERSWTRFRPELYFALMLLALFGVYRAVSGQPQDGNTPEDDAAPTTQSTVPSGLDGSFLSQELSNTDSALLSYVSGNRARTRYWIDSIANTSRFGPNAIDAEFKTELRAIATTIRKDSLPTTIQLARFRSAFYAYAYGRWMLETGQGVPADFRIDPTYRGYDSAQVERLVERLDLTDVLESPLRPNDPKVTTAVVIRWLQSYPAATDRL